MGRPPQKPNKKCLNCKYWGASREVTPGHVHLNDCLKTGHRIPHIFKCEFYVYYGGNNGKFAGHSENQGQTGLINQPSGN